MSKVDFRRLSENERQEAWQFFERMLSDLQTSTAIGAFLADMLTPSERVMLGRRVRIAQLLLAGFSQDEICKKL
ncbi:hypothetical protein HZA45_02860, partial [Candidatus Peregrinibacteria bacterium]|nr:hypothetical protein [Candidatus Peregrinibacteria bacterium]